eukprot:20282-Eustigmatos_ZCMA.PRE.1
MGSSDYTATLNGYTFYFASKENMETFVSAPWSYAPAFGGYCSWGMTEEHEVGSRVCGRNLEHPL